MARAYSPTRARARATPAQWSDTPHVGGGPPSSPWRGLEREDELVLQIRLRSGRSLAPVLAGQPDQRVRDGGAQLPVLSARLGSGREHRAVIIGRGQVVGVADLSGLGERGRF